MNQFIVKSNNFNKPKVFYNEQTSELYIVGRAITIDYEEFLDPIMQWATEFSITNTEKCIVIIDLDYFNTVALKSLMRIFAYLIEKFENKNLIIRWYYFDEDTFETIADFEDTLNFKIEKINKFK